MLQELPTINTHFSFRYFSFGIVLVLPSLGPVFFVTAVEGYQQQNLMSADGIFTSGGKKRSRICFLGIAFTNELKMGRISFGILRVGDAEIF